MRYSKLLIPTTREVPAEAEIPSHRLMIRAGFVRKLASGTYTYLLVGWRSLRKIARIVRQEMDLAGAQEISMPILQPIELWRRTGRDVDYGQTLGVSIDRHGRTNVLAPTAEEVVTSLVAGEVKSYKQLPLNLYQINTKIRDEFRPRFGVLRSREFLMKDAYSFDATAGGMGESYRKMHDAYCRIFRRCGLSFVVVEAASGEIGGSGSEEFMVPCESGEDVIVYTEDEAYAANIEKAGVDPVLNGAERQADSDAAARTNGAERQAGSDVVAGIEGSGRRKDSDVAARIGGRGDVAAVEEVHTPNVGSIGEVCEFLGTRPDEMMKTLIYQAGEQVVVAIIRGDHEVNETKLRAALGGEAMELAGEDTIREVTGAGVGFAGPQGLAGKVNKLIIDHAVAAMQAGVTGANRTDYHVRNVVPGRDFPLEGDNVAVADIRNAVEGDTHDGKPLLFRRGIEVGHVFKLGTKYSEKLGATFLDESGCEKPCVMGTYGIGINRILASAIEIGHDDKGCILPISIAPFEVEVIPLNNDKEAVRAEADRIYNELQSGGVDVLLDDRDVRGGVKFNDADLLGIPLRVVVGQRSLEEGNVEIKLRGDAKPTAVPAGEAVAKVRQMIKDLKQAVSA